MFGNYESKSVGPSGGKTGPKFFALIFENFVFFFFNFVACLLYLCVIVPKLFWIGHKIKPEITAINYLKTELDELRNK